MDDNGDGRTRGRNRKRAGVRNRAVIKGAFVEHLNIGGIDDEILNVYL